MRHRNGFGGCPAAAVARTCHAITAPLAWPLTTTYRGGSQVDAKQPRHTNAVTADESPGNVMVLAAVVDGINVAVREPSTLACRRMRGPDCSAGDTSAVADGGTSSASWNVSDGDGGGCERSVRLDTGGVTGYVCWSSTPHRHSTRAGEAAAVASTEEYGDGGTNHNEELQE